MFDAGAVCTPFKVHRGAVFPDSLSLQVSQNQANLVHLEEKELIEQLSKVPFHEQFAQHWSKWRNGPLPSKARKDMKQVLRCFLSYLQLDLDQDQIPDWTPLQGNTLALVLRPFDNDIDGDEIENIFDANPFQAALPDSTVKSNSENVPEHLKIHVNPAYTRWANNDPEKLKLRQETYQLQEQLFKQFGVLAVEHSDFHSAYVLKEFLLLLEKTPLSKLTRQMKVRFIYAFAGHDRTIDIAAYHPEMNALSIGGERSYRHPPGTKERVGLISSLAHELGHAFAFTQLTPLELLELSNAYGNWNFDLPQPTSEGKGLGHFDERFFSSYRFSVDDLGLEEQKKFNIMGPYSLTNVHEWFADAFAAYYLDTLGQQSFLGQDWKGSLKRAPSGEKTYWWDYNNLSTTLADWFKLKEKSLTETQPPVAVGASSTPTP